MMAGRAAARRTEGAVQKDKPPSVLGEALLDAVIVRRKPNDYRPRCSHQPANTFVNRSGELASDLSPDGPSRVFRLAPPPQKGEG
jgi:hypothetical protein